MRWLSKNGFSLIEVMVAMMLVAGIGMAVMEMVSWQTKSARSIASVMDRNELQDRLRAMISNSFSCPFVFGSGQSTPPNYSSLKTLAIGARTSLPTIWDSQKRVFLTPSMKLPGLSAKILSLEFVTYQTATNGGGGNKKTYQTLTVKSEKIASNSSNPGIAVGGNAMKDIQIPVIVIVTPTGAIGGCSFDSGNGISADDCSQPGWGLVMGANGVAGCKKVLCEANTFPVGTDSSGINTGEIHCCAVGSHFAGTLEGNPTCCGEGQFYSVATNGCVPIASLCNGTGHGPGTGTHTWGNEVVMNPTNTDVTCCHTEYDSGVSGGTTNNNCSGWGHSNYYAQSFGGGCEGSGHSISAIRSNVSSAGKPIGVHVDCNGANANTSLNCCRDEKLPLVNTNPSQDCPTTMGPNYIWSSTTPAYSPPGSTGTCVFNSSTCVSPTEFVNSAGNGCKSQDVCSGSNIPDGSGGCTSSGGSDPCPSQTACYDAFGTFDHCVALDSGC